MMHNTFPSASHVASPVPSDDARAQATGQTGGQQNETQPQADTIHGRQGLHVRDPAEHMHDFLVFEPVAAQQVEGRGRRCKHDGGRRQDHGAGVRDCPGSRRHGMGPGGRPGNESRRQAIPNMSQTTTRPNQT